VRGLPLRSTQVAHIRVSTWEGEFQRSWDVVREDESGSLETAVNDFERSKRRRLFRDTDTIQRGIIRHIFLVVDLSVAMLDKDLRPSRLELTLSYSVDFVNEFFDQNPISQMGIIGMRNGIAERISGLSGAGHPCVTLLALRRPAFDRQPNGPRQSSAKQKEAGASRRALPAKRVGNGSDGFEVRLELTHSSYLTLCSHLPPHGSREVLVIFGSLTTCDPGNIHSTIDACVKARSVALLPAYRTPRMRFCAGCGST
jgi:transcription initiation factor TFIIH subunit 2